MHYRNLPPQNSAWLPNNPLNSKARSAWPLTLPSGDSHWVQAGKKLYRQVVWPKKDKSQISHNKKRLRCLSLSGVKSRNFLEASSARTTRYWSKTAWLRSIPLSWRNLGLSTFSSKDQALAPPRFKAKKCNYYKVIKNIFPVKVTIATQFGPHQMLHTDPYPTFTPA